jgi:phage gpG-like protein
MGTGASFKVDLSAIEKVFGRFDSDELKQAFSQIIAKKGVAAIVAQAIADNFEKEGPGWKPLSKATMRQTVTKVRAAASRRTGDPTRKILQGRGLLKKSVTTPGAAGNIYHVDGFQLEWGSNLVYAGIHNRGGTINHPGSKNAFGIRGLTTRAHKIVIPARPFLRISDFWYGELAAYITEQAVKELSKAISGGS